MKWAVRRIMVLIALIFSVQICLAEDKFTADIFAMDTHISITAYGDAAASALDEAEALLKDMEMLWSVTQEDSEISAVNCADGKASSVSAATESILLYALEMAEATDGAYDPTIYPLVSAWGFTTDNYRVPSGDEINEKLKLIDYRAVSIQDGTVAMAEGMQMDLGGIAKGYAGDEIGRLLEQRGVSSAMINLGGNIHAIGNKTDGSLWRIGVKSPMDDSLLGVLSVSDCCVITSGAYERYFIGEDQKRYGHIIDPYTGYPVDNGILSVTVIGRTGGMCDALSTALFVMGQDGACEYWRSCDDFEMILLTDENVLYVTEGIADSFAVNSSEWIREAHMITR